MTDQPKTSEWWDSDEEEQRQRVTFGTRSRTMIRTNLKRAVFAGQRCPYCQIAMDRSGPLQCRPTRDHVIPLSRRSRVGKVFGMNVVANIEIVCRHCNEEKGSLTKEEYVAWRLGLASRLDKGTRGDYIYG